MFKRYLLPIVLVLLPAGLTAGQQSALPAQKAPEKTQTQTAQQKTPFPEEDVVKLDTSLVQIDAVVTDKNGRYVTDLRPKDFEILEDGKPRKLTHFSYITAHAAPASRPLVGASHEKKGNEKEDRFVPDAPPARLRRNQTHRVIAIIVDDLSMAAPNVVFTRSALKKFVEQEMQPDDFVAFIQTRSGTGATQQLTSDKRQLLAAIERLRWNPASAVSAFAEDDSEDEQERDNNNTQTAGGPSEQRNNPQDGSKTHTRFRQGVLASGALGTLDYVIRGMREVPGRKSVLFISDGMCAEGPMLDRLRRLADMAIRSSVVIYTLDARGLPLFRMTGPAYSNPSISGSTAVTQPLGLPAMPLFSQQMNYFRSQSGLSFLARQTGGFFVHDSNDLSSGAKKVLEDQSGYYLIGYEPDDDTFKSVRGSRPFHNLTIRVKRKGLEVRSRTGFYAITNEESQPPATRRDQIINAFYSPFTATGIDLRLTTVFNNSADAGSVIQSVLFVGSNGLTFTKEDDGWMEASLDILAVILGENGEVVGQTSRLQGIRARPDVYETLMQRGLVISLHVPVKNSGAYQLRIVVRDSGSGHAGSASQFIEVPNLGKNRLALSSLVIAGRSAQPAAKPGQPAVVGIDKPKDDAVDDSDPQAGLAVRQYHAGMFLDYGYRVYNAQFGVADDKPRLKTKVRLFRDDKVVFTGDWQPFTPAQVTDKTRLMAGGTMRLGTDLKPGMYVFQVVVTDELAKEKYNTVAQWIDFEIVK